MRQNGYYDEGWNARVLGLPFDDSKSRAWRDGWNDADEAIADGEQIGEML